MDSDAPTDTWFLSDVSPTASMRDTFLACLGILFFIGMVYIMLIYVWVVLTAIGEALQMLYEFLKKLFCGRKKDNEIDEVEDAVEIIYMKPPNPVSEPNSDIKKPELNNNEAK